MAYKNEKYEHIKAFWKLDNASESSLFWQLEKSGWNACDINVLHAIRKFQSNGIIMNRKLPKGKDQFEWTMTGLPSTIEKHTPASASQVWSSIEKLTKAGIITKVNGKVEEKYGGKQRKVTIMFDVNLSLIRDIIASQSTSKLF